ARAPTCFSLSRYRAPPALHSFPTRRSSDLKDESDGFVPYTAFQPGATTRDRRYDITSVGLKYGIDFTTDLRLSLHGVHTGGKVRSEEHTSELQSRENLVCRLLLEKKKNPSVAKVAGMDYPRGPGRDSLAVPGPDAQDGTETAASVSPLVRVVDAAAAGQSKLTVCG